MSRSTAMRRFSPIGRQSSKCCSISSIMPANMPPRRPTNESNSVSACTAEWQRSAWPITAWTVGGCSAAAVPLVLESAEEAAASPRGSVWGFNRRLARDMGGDLRLDESVADEPARFVLSLPIDA